MELHRSPRTLWAGAGHETLPPRIRRGLTVHTPANTTSILLQMYPGKEKGGKYGKHYLYRITNVPREGEGG